MQNTAAAHPELHEVPTAMSLAKTDAGRKLIQLALHDVGAITYIYHSFPPGKIVCRSSVKRSRRP